MSGAFDGELWFGPTRGSRTLPIDLFMTEEVRKNEGLPTTGGHRWPLTLGEATSLRDQLDSLLFQAEQEHVVQVEILGNEGKSNRTYAYLDHHGNLEEDDLVRVPFGFSDTPKVGIVRSYGRDGYSGPLKSVLARFHPVDL